MNYHAAVQGRRILRDLAHGVRTRTTGFDRRWSNREAGPMLFKNNLIEINVIQKRCANVIQNRCGIV